MVTIQSLEVRFEVEGDDREQFARLFSEFIRRHEERAEGRRTREDRDRQDRALGDAPTGGARWS